MQLQEESTIIFPCKLTFSTKILILKGSNNDVKICKTTVFGLEKPAEGKN